MPKRFLSRFGQLLLKSNLRLLLGQLERLAETPYFTPALDQYISELRAIPRRLLERLDEDPPIDEQVANFIEKSLWSLSQFLTGSTTKQIPYEVVFSVTEAAKEWTRVDLLVTTAIIQEPNFYFKGIPQDFFDAVKSELGLTVAARPVQVALPYIYRHKPLFCVPLFHELGHFIDISNEVVATSMLTTPPERGPDLPDLPTAAQIPTLDTRIRANTLVITTNHRREYFADLFAAMYVGTASDDFLQEFAPNQPASPTHPSSQARRALIADFLGGRKNPIVELFQATLPARGLPALGPRFEAIDLSPAFSNVRPVTPARIGEVFGLFQAAWDFAKGAMTAPQPIWAALTEQDRERIVNDLVEKSIRNHMVVQGWHASAH